MCLPRLDQSNGTGIFALQVHTVWFEQVTNGSQSYEVVYNPCRVLISIICTLSTIKFSKTAHKYTHMYVCMYLCIILQCVSNI